MDDRIDTYIRENRARYTPEGIRRQLLAAGYESSAIDAAWERPGGEPAPVPIGWRPRWREFLILVVLGVVGTAVVWAGEPYGSGVIAPVVYVIVVSMGFAIAKGFSLMVDGGSILFPAIILGLVAIAAGVSTVIGSTPLVSGGILVLAGVPALLLLYMRATNPGGAGVVGAALPILVWLAVTGTCYTPLLSRLQGG